MAGLPLLKLSSLLIKTISKPLATRLKFEASRLPAFYDASVRAGQASHYMSSRVNVFASGYKFLGVKPLPADEALDMGVSYLADGIVIALGATVIIIEYKRGELKNAIKAEKAAAKEEADKVALEARFSDIELRIHEMDVRTGRALNESARAKLAITALLSGAVQEGKISITQRDIYQRQDNFEDIKGVYIDTEEKITPIEGDKKGENVSIGWSKS